MRASNAIVLGTPENFGYMSGALKDFLERIYYVVLDETPGHPYALYVKARPTVRARCAASNASSPGSSGGRCFPPLVVTGELHDEHVEAAHELGLTSPPASKPESSSVLRPSSPPITTVHGRIVHDVTSPFRT